MELGSVIGGIGIGSIAASILTQYFSAKDKLKERVFHEKKAAYLGWWDAIYLSEAEPFDKNALKVGHWQNLISLVGSLDVLKFAQDIHDTNNDLEGRKTALKNIKQAMREDLGIDKRKM